MLLGESHAERAGLLNDDLLWIRNLHAITGTVCGNVTEVSIWKLGIEQVECSMSCVENKGLVEISLMRLNQCNLLVHL